MNQTNSIARLGDRQRRTSLSEGYAAVFATVLIWSTPSLFMYYLNRYYDPWAQNFYRYFVAFLAIAPLVFYRIHRGGPGNDPRAVGVCFLSLLPHGAQGGFLPPPRSEEDTAEPPPRFYLVFPLLLLK